jgi:hypothetical protein
VWADLEVKLSSSGRAVHVTVRGKDGGRRAGWIMTPSAAEQFVFDIGAVLTEIGATPDIAARAGGETL